LSKLPLVDGINKYIEEKNIYFCMPGHKNGKGFIKTKEGKKLYNNFIKGDITEVDGVDNYHDAKGIIKEAQTLLSEFYGSKKSYFLINGSTSGNLAMIFSAFDEGDKIIVERNCHRSIYNAIVLKKLKPIYLKNEFNSEYSIPVSIDKKNFINVINNNRDAKGIVITYPNYYGICVDLNEIVNIAHEYGMKVLVDSAHGAHFGVCSDLPQNAIRLGADIVVMSAHKTLPSLTQTAYLHIGNKAFKSDSEFEKIDFYVSALSSTSPSYMFMTSMDYARFYLEKYGKKHYEELINLCNKYRHKINNIKGFRILDINSLNYNNTETTWKCSLDMTRYILNVDLGYSGHKLYGYLRENRIQCEMSDSRNIILIFSPFNTEEEFGYLYEVLKKCPLKSMRTKKNYSIFLDNKLPKIKLYPYEIMNKATRKIPIEEAEGNISAVQIVPYPPGIPIIMPGEVINRYVLNIINQYIMDERSILGIENGSITIIDV